MSILRKGTTLKQGEYIIERVLDQGGFGITYLARQKALERDVAIKEFFKIYCERDDDTGHVRVPQRDVLIKEKFKKEAKTLASLKHNHIISVIDVWEEKGTAYYSMPYLPGGSLRNRIQKKGPLSEEEALRYVTQVANALKYIHSKRLCHYDVKPANIMLDEDDNAVLIDFGISKLYDAVGKEMTCTPTGWDNDYAPKEQRKRHIEDFSPECDIYALGATLYNLVTGKIPPDAPEMLQFDSTVSPVVQDLIKGAMVSEASLRPQSMDYFLNFKASKPLPKHQPQPKPQGLPIPSENTQIASTPKKSQPQAKPQAKPLSTVKIAEQIARQLAEQGPYAPPKRKTGKYYIIGGVALLLLLGMLFYLVKGNPFNSSSADKVLADSLLQVGISYYYGDSIYTQNYTEAVNHFTQAAMAGNASAQSWLGSCYYEGKGVERSYDEAVKWHRKAADQGNSSAQNRLGVCYYNGNGVEQSYTEAAKWFRKAAEQNNAWAQNNLGNCYYHAKDYTEAIKWYRKAAEQNNSWAQNNLGNCYYNAKDYTEAVKWYRKSAEQGYSWAQNNLGNCYYNGKGVDQSYDEAVKWYRKSAEQGYSWAQYNLGNCYYHSHGVEKDYTEAVMWYRKAAEQGLYDAQKYLGNCYMYGHGVEKNSTEALKWYRKSADKGLAIAQYDLGYRYFYGHGVDKDYIEAIKWIHKAADQGYAKAQLHLARCYKKGDGVEKSYTEAVKWYRKAAEQGDEFGQFNLADCYENGIGVPKDKSEAIKWYRKAADQGNGSAISALKRLGVTE